jgi:hypothetical protein
VDEFDLPLLLYDCKNIKAFLDEGEMLHKVVLFMPEMS